MKQVHNTFSTQYSKRFLDLIKQYFSFATFILLHTMLYTLCLGIGLNFPPDIRWTQDDRLPQFPIMPYYKFLLRLVHITYNIQGDTYSVG